MEGESTEDEEDLTEEETDIKYVYLHIFLKELLLLYKEITPPPKKKIKEVLLFISDFT